MVLAGCRQILGLHDIDTDAAIADAPRVIDATDAPALDGSTACWTFAPTNFDPCALPAPQPLSIAGTIALDVDSTTLPSISMTQSDGSIVKVIHVSMLSFGPTATL